MIKSPTVLVLDEIRAGAAHRDQSSLCFRFARVAVSGTSNARFHYLRALIMTTEILRNIEESSGCRKVYYHRGRPLRHSLAGPSQRP